MQEEQGSALAGLEQLDGIAGERNRLPLQDGEPPIFPRPGAAMTR
jgi:hypothetical protein